MPLLNFGRQGLGFGDSMRRIIAMGEGEPAPEERELTTQPATPTVGGLQVQPEGRPVAAGGGLGVGTGGLSPLMTFRRLMYQMGHGGASYGQARGQYGGMPARALLQMRAQSLWAPQKVPPTQRGDYSRSLAQRRRGPRVPSTLRAA